MKHYNLREGCRSHERDVGGGSVCLPGVSPQHYGLGVKEAPGRIWIGEPGTVHSAPVAI